MAVDLEHLNSTNISTIVSIVSAAQLMGLDREITRVAIGIANAESNLGLNLTNSESSAKGIFHYLDGSWADSWKRAQKGGIAGLMSAEDLNSTGLTSSDARLDPGWQTLIALNDISRYHDGFPESVNVNFHDKIEELIGLGYHPDSDFLQYAYLRHNTSVKETATILKRDLNVLSSTQN